MVLCCVRKTWVHDLGTWLKEIGLGSCQDLLAAHDIDRDVLPTLTDRDLERIGLSLGQRRKLLRAVAGLAGSHDVSGREQPGAAGRAERRQMTVMFCDLVGSTALATRLDPEDLRPVIRTYLEEITATVARFGGYVARYMGDGALVYFGWPRAYEDAAEQAVRAGLAVVDAAQGSQSGENRLEVRVGIATGLVIVGDVIGAGASREHVIVGETPNLAARLQSVAHPNTVVISAATRRLLGQLFELQPAGPFDLKGVPGPVPAWRVLHENDSDSRFKALHVETRGGLVGRYGELALLGDLWARTVDGAGQVVLLSGEAGIGKTRIVEAFGDGLDAGHHLRLRYQCLPNSANSALHPVIRGLARTSGFEHADSQETRIAKLRWRLHEIGLTSEESLATFAGLLSLGDAPRDPQAGDPRQRKARLLALLVDYLSRLAERQPVLLQLEDAHWSDPTTLELCGVVVERAAGLRLMMIATARPEFSPTWPKGAHVRHETVSRLGRGESAEMVRRVVGSKPLPPTVSEQILAKTDGVPLFIEELTTELLESGALAEDREGWRLTGPMSSLSVPPTLQDSLTARLDRLGWSKEVAQTAAAIGRDFPLQLLASVMDLPAGRLADGLGRLCDAQLLVEQGTFPSSTYTFRHALIQDAAYAGLLLSERRELHATIARTLETQANFVEIGRSQPELLAHHYTEAREPEQAMTWWRRAGQRSIQKAAYVEAIDQLNRCLAQLELLPETAKRDRLEAGIRVDLGVPLIGVAGYTSPELRHNIARGIILQKRTKGVSLFPTLAGQLGFAFSSSDMVQAVALGEQFLAAAEETGERKVQVIGHWLLGMALTGAACFPAARAHLARSLELNNPEQDAPLAAVYGTDPRVAALGYQALALQQLGFPDQAAATDAASMARALECGHSATLGYALTLRVCLHMLRHDHAALTASTTELANLAKRQSSQHLQVFSGTILDLLQAAREPDSRTHERVRAAIDGIRAVGWNVLVGWLSLLEAETFLLHGHTEAAQQTLDALHDLIEPRGHHLFLPELFRLRAELAAREEQADGVIEGHLRRAMEVARRQGARLAELRSAVELARLWRDRGRLHAAHALVSPLHSWFEEGAGTADLERARSLVKTLSY